MRRVQKMIMIALALCIVATRTDSADQVPAMTIHSTAFPEAGTIPKLYSCEGEDYSPPLSWSGVPQGTKSLALVLVDPDAPSGVFTHWVAYNLPSRSSGLPENLPKTPTLVDGGRQALNDFGRVGYNGPCPPPGPPHHYDFQIYALAIAPHLPADADARAIRAAIRGHVLATGETVGLFAR